MASSKNDSAQIECSDAGFGGASGQNNHEANLRDRIAALQKQLREEEERSHANAEHVGDTEKICMACGDSANEALVQKPVALIPEAFNIGGDEDQALYMEDPLLPEPPEAPPVVDDAASFSVGFEDSFLPEPPEAPPELQGADYHEVCATDFELGGMVPLSLWEAAIGSAVDGGYCFGGWRK